MPEKEVSRIFLKYGLARKYLKSTRFKASDNLFKQELSHLVNILTESIRFWPKYLRVSCHQYGKISYLIFKGELP